MRPTRRRTSTRLHAVIAAELTEEQKGRLRDMIDETLHGARSQEMGHPHDEADRR